MANLTVLYINSEAVIPAKAGIQIRNTGFRVKPGMTKKAKELLIHYTRKVLLWDQAPSPLPSPLACLREAASAKAGGEAKDGSIFQ